MHVRLVGNTHIVAGGAEVLPDVVARLEEEGIRVRGNPDVYVKTYAHFGVHEARDVRERASLRSFGERRVFVIATPDINREAQNALLKTLEETPGDALFVFVVPAPETLLPTLRSRMQMLALDRSVKKDVIQVKVFLSAAPKERLEILKPLLEKGEGESGQTGKRDLAKILDFLSALELGLTKSPRGLDVVYRARKYITDKGALVKPLLEQVALLAPKV